MGLRQGLFAAKRKVLDIKVERSYVHTKRIAENRKEQRANAV